jgi:hypothetical protein
MYKLLKDSFYELFQAKRNRTFSRHQEIEFLIDKFRYALVAHRFPLLQQRIQHLEEIRQKSMTFALLLDNFSYYKRKGSVEGLLQMVTLALPGYANDLFLKRAILLILQMNRTCGIFEKDIYSLPIPADYQVPKMLEWLGCIEYSTDLKLDIRNGKHIPAGSQEEIEIRAATIIASQEIAKLAECTCADVDAFLWLKRKECSNPFHLTITTDY